MPSRKGNVISRTVPQADLGNGEENQQDVEAEDPSWKVPSATELEGEICLYHNEQEEGVPDLGVAGKESTMTPIETALTPQHRLHQHGKCGDEREPFVDGQLGVARECGFCCGTQRVPDSLVGRILEFSPRAVSLPSIEVG